jgi:hypothetical protein
MLQVEEPFAFYFAGPLREPEIVIVANTELEAKSEFRRIAGKVAPPRRTHSVVIASPDIQELMDTELCGVHGEEEFPLLSHFGNWSIVPEWVIDPKTEKVRISGEFESIPKPLLNLKKKPTPDEVRRSGGRTAGFQWDVEARILQDMMPWLNLDDGETLRQKLLDEYAQWERSHGK